MEGRDEYYIDQEQLGCCGVEDTMYTMIRSTDASWIPSERGRVVHTLEDNPNLGYVTIDNLTLSYESLSALRELIEHFCVNKGIFNDLYKKEDVGIYEMSMNDYRLKYKVNTTFSPPPTEEDIDFEVAYIGAPY